MTINLDPKNLILQYAKLSPKELKELTLSERKTLSFAMKNILDPAKMDAKKLNALEGKLAKLNQSDFKSTRIKNIIWSIFRAVGNLLGRISSKELNGQLQEFQKAHPISLPPQIIDIPLEESEITLPNLPPQPQEQILKITEEDKTPLPIKETQNLPSENTSNELSAKDLTCFRACLRNCKGALIASFDKQTYVVKYNPNKATINIQNIRNDCDDPNINKLNKLGVIITHVGEIVSVWIDSKDQNTTIIPKEKHALMNACFKEARKKSATFHLKQDGSSVLIKTVYTGVKESPDYHLENLSEKIEKAVKKQKWPTLEISFLEEDFKNVPGVDAGGLSRDYLNNLFEGILTCEEFHFSKANEESSIVIPACKEGKKTLETLEKWNYQRIGRLLMYCYHSKSSSNQWNEEYGIGHKFQKALFAAVLCLTAEEINTPFENLTLESRLKMCKTLLKAQLEAGEAMPYLKQLLKDLENFDLFFQSLNNNSETFLLLANTSDLDPQLLENDVLSLEKAKEHKTLLKEALINALFEAGSGRTLSPIHAIAQGMKSVCSPGHSITNDDFIWDNCFLGKTYVGFSDKVQGSLDRKKIADVFEIEVSNNQSANQEITQKVKWLKEWVLDSKNGAKEEELMKLLRFLTGSTGLIGGGKKITVKAFSTHIIPMPVLPAVHTCSFELELPPKAVTSGGLKNDTKEAFLKTMKAYWLDETSFGNV